MRILAIFVILPLLGAVIGYTTKWVSVRLLFWPRRWIGIGPFGWQGVVQRRSPKFATGIAEMLVEVVPVTDVVGRIDVARFVDVLADSLRPRLDAAAPAVVGALSPGTWDTMAPQAQEMVATMISSEANAALAEIAEAVVPALEKVDISPLIVEMLSGENADRLSDLVQGIAAHELRTVIRYGAVVGFVVGLAEAVLYLVFERWWLLPLVGAIDGVVNNYMGIQMIFRPLEPKRYFGVVRYQGLFPARQSEIARDYGAMLAAEVLTPDAIARHLSGDPIHDELAERVVATLRGRLGPQLQMLAPMLGVDASPDVEDRVIAVLLDAVGIDTRRIVPRLEDHPAALEHLEGELAIAATIHERLAELPKEEFESILRGIFTEDEKVLIGIGAVIGAAIGTIQAVVVLALG